MKKGSRRKNNTKRVLAKPVVSESGLEFLSTSYAGAPGEPSLRDEPLGRVRNIRVKNSNQVTTPKQQALATRLVNFYGRDFNIAPDVLIPRPETEMMVDAVLSLVGKPILPGVKPSKAKLPQDCSILDVGTGSGCIVVTLALELPRAKVTACDVSEKALAVARENAQHLRAQVSFIESDLMDSAKGNFDIVVANLPYVDENWDWIDKEALSVEPALALYAEDGGLALIKKLIRQVSELEISYLILEADPCQHERVIEYTNHYGYSLLETRGFCLAFSRGNRRE